MTYTFVIKTLVRPLFCSVHALEHLNHRTAFVPLIPSDCVLSILKPLSNTLPPPSLSLDSRGLHPFRECQGVVKYTLLDGGGTLKIK